MLDNKEVMLKTLAVRGAQAVIITKFSTVLAENDLTSRDNVSLLL